LENLFIYLVALGFELRVSLLLGSALPFEPLSQSKILGILDKKLRIKAK
jgi:hypothetical protein